MKRTITITIDDKKLDVREDGRTTGQLSWDEMIGHVAAMTIPADRVRPSGIFSMRTEQEWAEYAERMYGGGKGKVVAQ